MAFPEEECDRAATLAIDLLDEKITPETLHWLRKAMTILPRSLEGKSKNIIVDDQGKALQNRVRLELQQIELATKAFYLSTGKRPTIIGDLVWRLKTMKPQERRGPYLVKQRITKVPWSNPYKISPCGRRKSIAPFYGIVQWSQRNFGRW